MICKKCELNIDDDSVYCKFCGKKQTNEPRKELKNPNGFGTVEKLHGRRRRPYAVRVTNTIEGGKQVRRYVSYHETLKEAKLALVKEQVHPSSPKANIKFSALYEEWIETKSFKNISKQTQDNYKAAYKHLKPLHNMKFVDIRTGMMQKVIDDLERSLSTKEKVKLLCNRLYSYAQENDIVNKNYAEFIILDVPEETDAEETKNIFTSEEREKILKADLLPGADITIILLYTGMRINELLSLTKDSIDFKNNTITGGLKTDAGRDRIIPIHPTALPYLKKHYDSSPNEMLFVRSDGRKLTDRYFRDSMFYPLLEALEIEKRPPHKTRHTFATVLAESGVDTLAIKEILGHEDYAFTANKYTHTDIKYLTEQIKKI